MARGSLLNRLYRFTWRYKMTPPGKLLTAMIGVASVGTITVEVPIYQICCAFLGLIFAAELTGSLLRPRLAVSPRWPATMTAGEETTVPVRLRNTTWRPALEIMLTLLERPRSLRHTNGELMLDRIGRGEETELPLRLRARSRGRLTLPAVDAHSTFPFNLVRIPGGQSETHELLVRPAFAPLRLTRLPSDAFAEVGEYSPSGRSGESIEYLGNREYTPGEPVRRLDVRAWARVGHPVVREYQDEQGSRLGIVVDTRLPAKRRKAAAERMEAAISLAAGIAASLLDTGYDVGLLATGTDLYAFDRSETDRLDTVLDLLGEIEPTPYDSLGRMAEDLIDRAERLAGLFVVLADWDESRERLLKKLDEAGVMCRVVLATDPRTTLALPETAIEYDTVDAGAVRRGEVGEL